MLSLPRTKVPSLVGGTKIPQAVGVAKKKTANEDLEKLVRIFGMTGHTNVWQLSFTCSLLGQGLHVLSLESGIGDLKPLYSESVLPWV